MTADGLVSNPIQKYFWRAVLENKTGLNTYIQNIWEKRPGKIKCKIKTFFSILLMILLTIFL